MRLALCQINTTVGDVDGNIVRILAAVHEAKAEGADLVIVPEQAIVGYPACDLLLDEQFIQFATDAVNRAADQFPIPVILGMPIAGDTGIHNSAVVIAQGMLLARYDKHLLPNYSVFDEKRWFEPGDHYTILQTTDPATGEPLSIGITICEDIWHAGGPAAACAAAGAHAVVNLSASPFHVGKRRERTDLVQSRARELGVYVALCNAVGAQDELIFDGASVVANPHGDIAVAARSFSEDIVYVDIDPRLAEEARLIDTRVRSLSSESFTTTDHDDVHFVELPLPMHIQDAPAPPSAEYDPVDLHAAHLWHALVLGVRDYCKKNGFTSVADGMSGGIDSAVVGVLACDALGAENVVFVTMPSEFTSEETLADAKAMAVSCNVKLIEFPISGIVTAFESQGADAFEQAIAGVAHENTQARIRGTAIMMLSNMRGSLVLATGNKSEFAVGYATLYGDMVGGLAPLKDVWKSQVFELARWRSLDDQIIPTSIIERPPTAELRPNQLDSDSLPDYDVLDPILRALIDTNATTDELVEQGFDRETVQLVRGLLYGSEFKRFQAPPGLRVSSRMYDRDRRVPITNAYREKRSLQSFIGR